MGWFSGVVVYMMVWWTLIFCVLPFGLRRDETGKPDDPRLKQKILLTTVLSVGVWLAIYLLIKSDLINFRLMAQHAYPE